MGEIDEKVLDLQVFRKNRSIFVKIIGFSPKWDELYAKVLFFWYSVKICHFL